MVKQGSLYLLLLLVQTFAASAAIAVEATPEEAVHPSRNIPEAGHDGEAWMKTGKLRRVQADTFFPDDDPYWNPNGIMERKPCIPFDQIREDQIENDLADDDCATNSCGGCCRAYNWLLCDEDSSFAFVACGTSSAAQVRDTVCLLVQGIQQLFLSSSLTSFFLTNSL